MKAKNIVLGLLTIVVFSGFVSAAITVTLGSPADNSWSTSRTVTFNCTCTGANATYDITWFVDGTNVSTNTSVSNNTATYYAYTFSADDCSGASWNCQCDSGSEAAKNGTARTIKVDSTAPTITYDGKSTVIKSPARPLEFTTSDNCGIDSRWWLRENYDSSSSTSFVDTDDISTWSMIPGIYTFNYSANDSAGNVKSILTTIKIRKKPVSYGGTIEEELPDYSKKQPFSISNLGNLGDVAASLKTIADTEVVKIGDFVLRVWMLIVGVVLAGLMLRFR